MQVFYYLRELDEALNYALSAGSAFDINDRSEYVSTIIGATTPPSPFVTIGEHVSRMSAGGHDGRLGTPLAGTLGAGTT